MSPIVFSVENTLIQEVASQMMAEHLHRIFVTSDGSFRNHHYLRPSETDCGHAS